MGTLGSPRSSRAPLPPPWVPMGPVPQPGIPWGPLEVQIRFQLSCSPLIFFVALEFDIVCMLCEVYSTLLVVIEVVCILRIALLVSMI